MINQHVVSMTAEPIKQPVIRQSGIDARKGDAEQTSCRVGSIVKADIFRGFLRSGIGENQIGVQRGVDREWQAEKRETDDQNEIGARDNGSQHDHRQDDRHCSKDRCPHAGGGHLAAQPVPLRATSDGAIAWIHP